MTASEDLFILFMEDTGEFQKKKRKKRKCEGPVEGEAQWFEGIAGSQCSWNRVR